MVHPDSVAMLGELQAEKEKLKKLLQKMLMLKKLLMMKLVM